MHLESWDFEMNNIGELFTDSCTSKLKGLNYISQKKMEVNAFQTLNM